MEAAYTYSYYDWLEKFILQTRDMHDITQLVYLNSNMNNSHKELFLWTRKTMSSLLKVSNSFPVFLVTFVCGVAFHTLTIEMLKILNLHACLPLVMLL